LRKLAETAIAAAELLERRVKFLLGEVRPVGIREHELGVRALPQQEVAEPLLAPRANQQVDVRHAGHGMIGRREPTLEILEVLRLAGLARGLEQRLPSRVVDCEPKKQLVAA